MKYKFTISALIITIAIVLPSILLGQRIRLYNSDEGLPSSQINSVHQDARGYIWIATQSGGAYFDGMRFASFYHDPKRTNSLGSDLVTKIYTDSRGRCWVGTSTKLQYFDYENNAFRNFPLFDDQTDEIVYISAIVETPAKDKIVISVSGEGIYVLNVADYTFNKEATEQIRKLLPTEFPGRLFFDSRGRLWSFAEQGNVTILDLDRGYSLKNIWSVDLLGVCEKIVVSAVIEDATTGNVILGTFNYGILIFDSNRGVIRRAKDVSASKYRVRALAKRTSKDAPNAPATFWVGTEDSGLRIFDTKTETISPAKLQNCPIDIDHCKAHSIMEDSQGNVWVGVYQKGLLVIPNSMYGFDYMSFSSKESTNPNQNSACVTAVVRDLGGDLWVGTDGGGLFRVGKDGKTENFTKSNSLLPNNSVMAIALDKRGVLWISTYMGGISTYKKGAGFTDFYRDDIKLKKIICLEYDRQNDIIYAGSYGSGVMVIHPESRKFEDFFSEGSAGWISTLFLDSQGRLWGGGFQGVHCYDIITKKSIDFNGGTMAEGSRIYSVVEANDGVIWIGSSDGLTAYNPAKDNYKEYTTANGLAANTVYAIQKSGDNNLWISTNHGMSRFDISTEKFKNYYSYDGLQDNEFRFGATHKDSDGRIFFGGINGLTSFYPNTVERAEHPMPQIIFSRMTVFNELVDYDEELGRKNILDKYISQATKVTLKRKENVFSIEFAVLEYTNPDKIVYGYKMEGFDKDWQYTDANHRVATYTNLPEGRYRFRVKAFFDGTSQEDVVYKELAIRILPPWYKTWWAYLGYLLLLSGALWQLRVYIKSRKQRLLERIEMDKKEMKLQMFTNFSHEIRTPLTLVMTPLKVIRESEIDPRRKEIYNMMYRNVLRILRIVNQLMDMRKIDNNQLQICFNESNVVEFIKSILKSFEQVALIRNIDLRLITSDDEIMVWLDQSNFDKVIFNILANAFKHVPDNGYIWIRVNRHINNRTSGIPMNIGEYVEISIENSGENIEEGFLEKIFDRFFQTSTGAHLGGTGIGLHLSRMVVSLHHGTITASNTDGGVRFVVHLPMGEAHLTRKESPAAELHKDLYRNPQKNEAEDIEPLEMVEMPVEQMDSEQKNSKIKRTIVLVDDDQELCKYLSMELSHLYNITTCHDGKQAWKVISTTVPDAVITDLVMPEMDGSGLCRKIKQSPDTNHIPVIILTSMTDEESEQLCMDSGGDRFLTKPISLELLKGAIAQAIKSRETIKNKFRNDINSGYDTLEIDSPDSRFITRVIETIRKNMEDPDFSVIELSREVGISRVHLNRKLKENINISPGTLIKSIRLKQAAYLLVNNKVNISEVAYKVGFSTHSYFSNSFREYFGTTPKEFVIKYTNSEDKESLNKIFE